MGCLFEAMCSMMGICHAKIAVHDRWSYGRAEVVGHLVFQKLQMILSRPRRTSGLRICGDQYKHTMTHPPHLGAHSTRLSLLGAIGWEFAVGHQRPRPCRPAVRDVYSLHTI